MRKAQNTPNSKSKPIVINLEHKNENDYRDIDCKIRDSVPRLEGILTWDKFEHNKKIKILLDSGASFSCISEDLYNSLIINFPKFKLAPSVRNTPTSASGSKMTIIGDCILGVKFFAVLKWLHIKNIKFSVIRNLSQEAILGIEVLKMVGFQVIENSLRIGNLSFPNVEMSEYRLSLAVESCTPCWN